MSAIPVDRSTLERWRDQLFHGTPVVHEIKLILAEVDGMYTPWFHGFECPVRVGWYEVKLPWNIGRVRWCEEGCWVEPSGHPFEMLSCDRWRGLLLEGGI